MGESALWIAGEAALAMACTSIHDRAHGGKEVSSPVGAKAVRHVPKDRAHADRLIAGGMGGWKGGIVQEQEHVVLVRGLTVLQPSPMRGAWPGWRDSNRPVA